MHASDHENQSPTDPTNQRTAGEHRPIIFEFDNEPIRIILSPQPHSFLFSHTHTIVPPTQSCTLACTYPWISHET